MFATLPLIPLGPILLGAIWIGVWVALEVRNRRAARRGERLVVWVELVPYVVALVMVQLLLDLRVRWLGDIVALGVHTLVIGAMWIKAVRRRAR